jgi:predicted transcriptional regulator
MKRWMESKVITTHVPLELADRIDRWAARLQRSRGWIVKQALAAWADREDAAPAGEAPAGKAPAGRVGFAETQLPFAAELLAEDRDAARAAVETLKALRQTTTLGDLSWRALRDAGRR